MPATKVQTLRRSSRVPIHVPIHVTSLEPKARFSDVCETLVVSAHGFAVRFPIQLDAGSALQVHTKEGREATAYVVACQPLGSDGQSWRLGARLEQPDNFWGLKSYPDDWRVLEMPMPAAQPNAQRKAPLSLHSPQAPARPSQAILDKVEEQLSEERLRGILAKLVRPLQAEVNELHEKLARNARQNRFEVSLNQIPPELEQKLWDRLRQELGARVLEQTQAQSAEILASTKSATEQKIGAALTEFRHRLSGELHTVEQRAQALSKELIATARQQSHAGVEKLQQHALETGAQLTAHGEKLLSSLEERLAETHDAHRIQVEQMQADSTAKAVQIQSEVTDMGRKIATLNDSVRRLESDLDAHLEHLAGEIVSDARTQLDNAVASAVKDFQTRGSNEVETRLDEVCGHLRTIQNRIENSFSSSLQAQGEEAVLSIGKRFEDLAQQFMERWRLSLAKDLNAVAKTLGQDLRQEFPLEKSAAKG